MEHDKSTTREIKKDSHVSDPAEPLKHLADEPIHSEEKSMGEILQNIATASWEATKEKAAEAKEWASAVAAKLSPSEFAPATKDGKPLGEAIKGVANDVSEVVSEKAEAAKQYIGRKLSQSAEQLERAQYGYEQKVNDVKEGVKEKAEDVEEEVKYQAHNAKRFAEKKYTIEFEKSVGQEGLQYTANIAEEWANLPPESEMIAGQKVKDLTQEGVKDSISDTKISGEKKLTSEFEKSVSQENEQKGLQYTASVAEEWANLPPESKISKGQRLKDGTDDVKEGMKEKIAH